MNATADSSLGEERVYFSLQLAVFGEGKSGQVLKAGTGGRN